MGTRRKLLESLLPTNFLPRLPSAYQEVEYLESTGTQYIDSGVAPDSNNLRIELNAEFTSLPGSDISSFICGSANVGGTYRWNAIFLSRSTDNPITLQYSKNNSVQQGLFTSSLTCNAVYHINNGTITANINGVDFSDTCDNYTANHNSLYLFSRNDTGSPTGLGKAKLYSTKLWKDGVLLRDFIPCYRKADGVAGLYDIVNGVFYTNAGTGTFMCGRPVVSRVYQPVEYLESTGTQYIDTGAKLNNQSGIECNFKISTSPCYVLGTIEDDNTNTFVITYSGITMYMRNGGRLNVTFENINENTSHKATMKVNLFKLDNTVVAATNVGTTAYTHYSCLLFGRHRDGVPEISTNKVTIYSCKIWDNGVLIRDFVPCYRIADGVAGLLDKVHGVFYTNKGTGEFICGRPLIDPRYQRVEYIESTRTQYIDTGVMLDNSTKAKIYLDQQWLGAVSSLNAWSGTNGYSTIAYDTSDHTMRVNAAVDIPTADRQKRLQFYVLTNVNDDKRQAIYQGTTYTGAATVTNNGYYWLFGLYDNNPGSYTTYRVKQRIFECKIWKDNVLVRSFVPCYRKSDGEIGLYDIVEGKFYTNSGTGTFLKGQNI